MAFLDGQNLVEGKQFGQSSSRFIFSWNLKYFTPVFNYNSTHFHPILKAAGLERIRVYDLRHTCAAVLINEGAHPEHIKRHLGHSSITVTMDTYGHLYPDAEEALSERLDARIRAAQTDRRRTQEQAGLVSVGS